MSGILNPNQRKVFVSVLAVLVAVIVIYSPGLHGPFVFDDDIHILSDPSIRIRSLGIQELTRVLLSENELLGYRPLAKISLGINYYFSGGTASTYGYKLTNLGIHLANTCLVYWFMLLLLRQRKFRLGDSDNSESVAVLAAALWALHPLHLTTVLYVVQRMTSLAMLFVLAGLIIYIHGRQRVHERRDYGYTLMTAGALGGVTLGFLCKENAILLLPLMTVIEFIFFGTKLEITPDRQKLRWFYGLMVFVPITLLGLWVLINPAIVMDAYLSRDFTPLERVLTESRVLWYYVGLVFMPNVRELSLYHDDIQISHGIFDPWMTSIAVVSIISLLIIALIFRRKYPLISFSILWFLIGHSIESGVVGLEIAHEHRNYLPDLGIFLALGYGLFSVTQSFHSIIRNGLLLAPLITLGFVTTTLANTWASDEAIIDSLARYHPGSARGQYMRAEIYAERKHNLVEALVYYRRAAELAPNETGYLIKASLTITRLESSDNGPADNILENRIASTLITVLRRNSTSGNTSHNEISLRLKQRPITTTTLRILDQLTVCIDQRSPFCKAVHQNMKNWYLDVIQNPYTNIKDRRNFLIYLFNLGVALPDLDLSMQAANLGERIDPSNPVYLLMEANARMLRGELKIAETILHSEMQNPAGRLTVEQREDIQTLLEQIERRKTNSHHDRGRH